MSISVFNLMKDYPHVWLKIYAGSGKEQDIRYQFSKKEDHFVVIAWNMHAEPKCRHCAANLVQHVPCECGSTYMHSKCMAMQYEWRPADSKELFGVIERLGDFSNNFGDFSYAEIEENYERFEDIFDFNSEEAEEANFTLLTVSNANGNKRIETTNKDKRFEFIFTA